MSRILPQSIVLAVAFWTGENVGRVGVYWEQSDYLIAAAMYGLVILMSMNGLMICNRMLDWLESTLEKRRR